MKISDWIRHEWEPVSYCGAGFGWKERGMGFLLGFGAGMLAAMILFTSVPLEILTGVLMGWIFQKRYVEFLVRRRKKEFMKQFCDYLDAVSTSLSCGRNTYDSFLSAAEEMRELYTPGTPICVESGKVANGLKNGRPVKILLANMAEESRCTDVKTYGEIYSACSLAGGNVKKVTDDSKEKLSEKLSLESEIQTVLSGPKNELNIMALMPFVILASLRFMSGDFIPEDSVSMTVNLIALGLFMVSYAAGRKIVQIQV